MPKELKQEVLVYTKSNELIAKFTKDPPSNPQDAINMMVNPEVRIVQNGESTFTFSMNRFCEKWIDISDPENIYVVDGRKYTALNAGSFVYDELNVTVNLVETWYLLSKQYVQAYNVPAEREGIDEHSVVILPKSKEPLIINGKQYNNNPYPRGSAGYALWAVLRDSGWTLGTCDVIVNGFSPAEDYGVFNLETDQKDILTNINTIQSLWGGILVWDSMNNILHLRDENKWDTDNGFEIRSGKNLSAISITQSNDIITRLYPLGEGKLNIKAVNNGKTYLENFSYTNKIYSRILENPDIYDQKQLKFWGERKLAELCKPSRILSINLVDLRTTKGYEHEIFDINDIATVVYTDPDGKQLKEKQRIVSWSYQVFAPYNCTIECGVRNRNVIEIIKQAYNTSSIVDSIVNGNNHISSDNIWKTEVDPATGNTSKTSITQISNEHSAKIELNAQHITQTSESLANFKIEVADTYATIESFTKFENQTNQSITQIIQRSDEHEASIKLNATYISKNQKSIASLEIVADEHGSRIEANADKIRLNAREISANANKISLNAKQISLNADEIRVQGNLIANKASFSYVDAEVSRVKRLVADSVSANNISAIISSLSQVRCNMISCEGLSVFNGNMRVRADISCSDISCTSIKAGGKRLNKTTAVSKVFVDKEGKVDHVEKVTFYAFS